MSLPVWQSCPTFLFLGGGGGLPTKGYGMPLVLTSSGGTKAGGTHPTGMHSCFSYMLSIISFISSGLN